MLLGNKLFKQSEIDKYIGEEIVVRKGDIVPITTDDIPEGDINKYDLNYPDGKRIGDIIIRFSPDELPGHKRLFRTLDNPDIGTEEPYFPPEAYIYRYEAPDFYQYCLDNYNAYEQYIPEGSTSFVNNDTNPYWEFHQTEDEYYNFATGHRSFTGDDIPDFTIAEYYCPFYVLGIKNSDQGRWPTKIINVYTVEKEIEDNVIIGYTPIGDDSTGKVESGFIYKDKDLYEVYDTDLTDWTYKKEGGEVVSQEVEMEYVHVPTIPTYISGNPKTYYFVVTRSRVTDETSIRNIRVDEYVEKLDYEDNPWIINTGTVQNQVLKFGIPSGRSATIRVGRVKSDGPIPAVENVGTDIDAIFNFTLPKGDKGDAGDVVLLNYISATAPESALLNETWYNTTNNKILVYTGNSWKNHDDYPDAEKGIIYLWYNNVYYFDGTQLQKTFAEIQINTDSLNFVDGKLQAEGVFAKSGGIYYDWIGTLEDWELGRSNGTISDNWICYITND